MFMTTPYMRNPSAHTVRRTPSAFDPMSYMRSGDPYGHQKEAPFSIAGGAISGAVLGMFAGGLPGAAIGALGGAGVAAAGLGIHAGVQYYRGVKGAFELEGREYYLNEFWRSSPVYLTTPRGPRSKQAATMRQQMMMTIHNSAYSMRASIGAEAGKLHR